MDIRRFTERLGSEVQLPIDEKVGELEAVQLGKSESQKY